MTPSPISTAASPGIPTVFASYGGARYLFATPEHRRTLRALDIFNKDQSGTIAKAKSDWPTVKDKVL